jgi:hypothetical protein
VFEFVHDDNNAGRTLTPVDVTRRPIPNLRGDVDHRPAKASRSRR